MVARPILTIAILSCAMNAQASPRTDPTMGRAVFTGATVPHPTSILLNPAALGLGTADEVFVGMTSTLDLYSIDLDQLDASGQLVGGPGVTSTELGLGGVVSYIQHLGTRYTVSIELRSPPQETFPTGHTELRYHTLGGRQRDLLASIGSTIKATNRLYFGATLTHHNTFLRLKYARDTAAANGLAANGVTSDCDGAPCGYGNPAASELYDVGVNSPYVSTSNLKVTLGFLVRIYRDIWLGVGYHTPPGFNIQNELEGNVKVTRAPRDGGATITGDSVVDVSYPASVDAEISSRLPQFLELHIGGRWEDLSRMQAYDVRMIGSRIMEAGIPEWQLRTRGMHDAFAAWGGIEQVDYGQRWRFGGRLGVETSAVQPERTTPSTIAPDSFTLDLGAQLRVGSWMAQLSLGFQYFTKVEVQPPAFDPTFVSDCMASDFNYATRACEAVRNGYAIATNAGDYRRLLSTLRIGFRYELP